MRDRLGALIGALRARGIAVSVAEAIDGAAAAAAVGVERAALAEALAAALVKDEQDRAVFDECFARVFPPRVESGAPARRRRTRASPAPGEADTGSGSAVGAGAGGGRARAEAVPARAEQPRQADAAAQRPASGHTRGAPATPTAPERARAGIGAHERAAGGAAAAGPSARARALRRLPFAAMSPLDVEDASALVRALARQVSARVRRRLRPRRRGRLDVRRTLRAATPHGGVPLVRHYRGRRPRRPSLVALCDLSRSVAMATELFLALLAPAAAYFARVRLFGFVDRLVEIEFADGRVRPAGPVDLMARSDFGRVLQDLTTHALDDLTPDTVLLVLGDARNNRRPPRVDLLRLARERVRRVVWLDPEPVARWNTGDSVIGLYARHVDALVACGSLDELASAVAALARG